MHAQPVWWMQEAVLCSANLVDLLFLFLLFFFFVPFFSGLLMLFHTFDFFCYDIYFLCFVTNLMKLLLLYEISVCRKIRNLTPGNMRGR